MNEADSPETRKRDGNGMMKFLLPSVCALVLLGLGASRLAPDEDNLPRSSGLNAPLQIVSDERVRAELREIGYRRSLRTLAPIWTACLALVYRGDSTAFSR